FRARPSASYAWRMKAAPRASEDVLSFYHLLVEYLSENPLAGAYPTPWIKAVSTVTRGFPQDEASSMWSRAKGGLGVDSCRVLLLKTRHSRTGSGGVALVGIGVLAQNKA
ncbi:hypothetical protein FRC01_009050, partial [Tulasnella sp. 417]